MLQARGETEYHLFGNVRFRQGDTRLASDRAVWRQDNGTVWFRGHVLIQQPQRFLSADSVFYARSMRSFIAYSNVLVEDTAQSFSLCGERVRFDRDAEIAYADSNPAMRYDFLLDSVAQTFIFADTLIFKKANRSGTALGSVRVFKGDWRGTGEYGEIWPDSGLAMLTGEPEASGLGGIIRGDTLYLFYQGQRIERVQARGNTSGSYQDTSVTTGGQNLIRGDVADFFISGDTLRAIRVVGQAYTDYDPGELGSGQNNASGDSLWLDFDRGRLDAVTIRGGAQGVYRVPRADESEDTITYSAETIVFVPDSNRIDLIEASRLNYYEIQLDAGRISYWTDARQLKARPLLPDTGAVEPRQRPQLADAQQVVVGDTLTYDIDSRRGRIWGSKTEFEGGYYRGQDFRKFTDKVFFVTEGVYTTCELDEPHFRFESDDMVVIRDDKVVARPVVMRIGELPMFYLPYYVFPIRRGRHSGFLPLRFGNFEQGNRFISNAGYYWAASDYFDIEGALDFNEETGVLLRTAASYALRYKFHGSVSASYARETRLRNTGRTRRTIWRLQGNHQQTLTQTASLSGNMNFLSDKSYYDDYVYNPDDRRNRTLTSQLNFSKKFSKASLAIGLRATENLDTENRTRQLPQASLNFYQWRPFQPDSGQDARWYHNAYVGYSAVLNHYVNRFIETETVTQADSTVVESTDVKKQYATMSHRGSVSFPQRLFNHITVSPSGSFQETWYYVFDSKLARDQGVPVEDPGRRLSGSVGVGANTNLYGFVYPRLFGVSAIRHTLTPSVSYSFTPAVTQNEELRTFTGAGGGSRNRSQAVSVSLSNVFDAKMGEGENEKKISLFNVSISSSYNFEAETHKWSNLRASARTNLASRLDLSADATWDPYNEVSGDLDWLSARLLNFGLSAAASLKGSGSAFSAVTGFDDGIDDTLSASGDIPFNITMSYRYDEQRGSFFGTSKTHWISTRIDLEPTKNWSVSMQSRYDWVSNKITDQTFTFTRDLHCWRAQFTWRPGGSGQGYYFMIGVKEIPDIRITRSESGLRGALF
ncbi:MAG: hypothetical protein Kow0074_00560 [Candidatus Zixiibacteriota bacterium]